eukprot:scaffold2859_cov349-Pavlova_lutheri.AAC.55
MAGHSSRTTRRRGNAKQEGGGKARVEGGGRRGDGADPHAPASKKGATKNRWKSMKTRTISTVLMIGGFLGIIYMGHVYLAAMIVAIQMVMVNELFTFARKKAVYQEKEIPVSNLLQWYFFGVACFFVYGRFLNHNLMWTIREENHRKGAVGQFLLPLASWMLGHHGLCSYLLYITGFVLFTLSLKRGTLLYQFGQFAWTHMILFVVFTQSSFFVSNIFSGILWFLLPCAFVIVNDIMAYLSGFFFGRTPLIDLSPKKTWEGFIGALISTMMISFFMSKWMAQYDWMICPREDLSSGWITCDPDPVFLPAEYPLPQMLVQCISQLDGLVPQWVPRKTLTVLPIQLHAVVLAAFASIIAPFGGFFASGFKRAFKIKDFGDSIPGHGGLTDRMDCQCVMALFSYMYYHNFVSVGKDAVSSLLSAFMNLEQGEQFELFTVLKKQMHGTGLCD